MIGHPIGPIIARYTETAKAHADMMTVDCININLKFQLIMILCFLISR